MFGPNGNPVATYQQFAYNLGQTILRSESESHFLPADWPTFAQLDAWARRSLAPLFRSVRRRYNPGVAEILAEEAPDELVETVHKMSKVCREHGVPLAAAALQFSIKDPRVVSTMVGLSRPERVEQTLELAAHPVPDELWPRLEALVPEEQHGLEVSRWT